MLPEEINIMGSQSYLLFSNKQIKQSDPWSGAFASLPSNVFVVVYHPSDQAAAYHESVEDLHEGRPQVLAMTTIPIAARNVFAACFEKQGEVHYTHIQ